MMDFFSLFKKAPKNKQERGETDQTDAKPAIEHSVSSSSKTSTVSPPATLVNNPGEFPILVF